MIKKLAVGALLLASLGVMAAQAQTVLYSTFPADPSIGLCLGSTYQIAVGVRNNTNVAYKIGGVKVYIRSQNVGFTVFSDDSGKPGSPIAELGTLHSESGDYEVGSLTVAPGSQVTLAPQTSYWIVASTPMAVNDCDEVWMLSYTAPTGLLTHVAYTTNHNGQWGSIGNQVAIELIGAVPPAPDAPAAPLTTTSSEAVTLNWSAPADNGSPITKYTVTGIPGGNCTKEVVPPATIPETSCTVTGLTNGTPYKFTVVATNANGDSIPSPESAEAVPSADITFVGGGPTISLAGGVVAAPYSQPLNVSGGLPPYTFSVVGDLPPGLALNSSTGVVSGTPTTPGSYTFSVGVADTVGTVGVVLKAVHVAEQTFTIVISAAPVAQPTPVPTLGGVGLLLLSGAVAGSMGLMRRRKSN